MSVFTPSKVPVIQQKRQKLLLENEQCIEDVLVEIDGELRDEKIDLQLLQSTPVISKEKRQSCREDEEHKAIFNNSNIEHEGREEAQEAIAQDWTGKIAVAIGKPSCEYIHRRSVSMIVDRLVCIVDLRMLCAQTLHPHFLALVSANLFEQAKTYGLTNFLKDYNIQVSILRVFTAKLAARHDLSEIVVKGTGYFLNCNDVLQL